MDGQHDWTIEHADAVLATMHGKEQVITPLLQAALGLLIAVPQNFDTDRFGSFSREIPRTASPLDTARAKIAAAFEQAPQARVGVASEGSFGPHPQIPFVPCDSEIVLLVDRRNGLEVAGHHLTSRTNFAQTVVDDPNSAKTFAERMGFPGHGVIVVGTLDGQPAPTLLLQKNIDTIDDLMTAVGAAIQRCGAAHVETDMRAHRNPTRMRAIKRATLDLIRRYRARCPRCMRPGFVVTAWLPGLPCAACGMPTDMPRAEVLVCGGCAWRLQRELGASVADPGRCDRCNP